jgi:hypothetical protein
MMRVSRSLLFILLTLFIALPFCAIGEASTEEEAKRNSIINLDDVMDNLEMTEMLDLSGSALSISKSFLRDMAPMVTPLVDDLSYVRIRAYTVEDHAEARIVQDKLERTHLKSPDWKIIMKSKPADDETTALYVREDKDRGTVGLLVFNAKDREVKIVNLAGEIDLSKMGDLAAFVRSDSRTRYGAWFLSPSEKRDFGLYAFTWDPKRLDIDLGDAKAKLKDAQRELEKALRKLERDVDSDETREKLRKSLMDALRALDSPRMGIVRPGIPRGWTELESGPRSYLGVRVYDLRPEEIENLKTEPYKEGAVVSKIYVGSPADHAGIFEKDVIVTINGKEIKGSKGVVEAISKSKPGDKVMVMVIREGEKRDIDVRIGERPVDFDMFSKVITRPESYSSDREDDEEEHEHKSGNIYKDEEYR